MRDIRTWLEFILFSSVFKMLHVEQHTYPPPATMRLILILYETRIPSTSFSIPFLSLGSRQITRVSVEFMYSRTSLSELVRSHGGGGQVGVLVPQSSVQRQASLLLVLSQQGHDVQIALVAAPGLHCLSKDDKTQRSSATCLLIGCFSDVLGFLSIYPNSLLRTVLVYLSAE